MAATDYISFRRLSHFWDKAKQYIADRISEIIQPSGDKEIINVLTYDSSAPSSPSAGDYYINSSSNKLYKYVSSSWTEQTADKNVIYITLDTTHMYVYDGTEFKDVTGGDVDNVIYVRNLTTDLEDYTDRGVYTVCQSKAGGVQRWYTLTVTVYRNQGSTGRKQVLHNNECYMSRTKGGDTAWSDWTTNTYAYTTDIDALKPLIYAGL